MTFDKYEELACKTERQIDEEVKSRFRQSRPLLMVMMAGLGAWEVANDVKRYIFYNDLGGKNTVDAALASLGKASIPVDDLPDDETTIRLVHAWLGILSEVPELGQAILMQDGVNITEESGDIKWYGAVLDNANRSSGTLVATANILKLQKRYPDKFTEQDALERDTEAELGAITKALTV